MNAELKLGLVARIMRFLQPLSRNASMRDKLDDVLRREGILEGLKHPLQALSLEAAEQVRLFPDFVHKNDALVLDFDHWRLCAVGNYGKEMTPAQLESLQAIDAHIGTATPSDTAVWDEDGLYTNPYWRELRVLAAACLANFGWPMEIPPSDAHEYVPGRIDKRVQQFETCVFGLRPSSSGAGPSPRRNKWLR